MQAASREAMTNLRTEVSSVLGRFSSTKGLTGLAEELYSVADLLTAQPRLRRRLADPASTPEQRTGLADALLTSKISASALSVIGSAVGSRWSAAWDLVDAIELSGDEVLLAAAETEGVLDSVEDELFRLERMLDAESSADDPARRGDRRGDSPRRPRRGPARGQGAPGDGGARASRGHAPSASAASCSRSTT